MHKAPKERQEPEGFKGPMVLPGRQVRMVPKGCREFQGRLVPKVGSVHKDLRAPWVRTVRLVLKDRRATKVGPDPRVLPVRKEPKVSKVRRDIKAPRGNRGVLDHQVSRVLRGRKGSRE